MIGHNALAGMAAEIAMLHRDIEGHHKQAAKAALAAGEKLAAAKAQVGHGNWAAWLSETGLGERTAQRYMKLHRHALNSDTVTDLGGIAAALSWLAPAKLPSAGSLLLLSADGFEPDGEDLIGFVWPHGRGHHVAMLDLRPEWPRCVMTKAAMLDERAVWLTLWVSCDWRCSELSFETVSDKAHTATFTAMVENLRAEMQA
ncbi:DUF3102 domain-containing protein [Frigidibacter sp. MR17.24]|uniref:DUF3102 domain-containing protein n=1 Tax=Frigidibacter sp. MR17.24 TaxID=3127345 RepID=UPI003012E1E8